MVYMTDETMQRTNIYLADVDREGLEVIKAHYGSGNNSAVIRMLIRREAREIASMEKRQGKDDE